MTRFDLSFGNSVAVREALLETFKDLVIFTPSHFERFDYPVHEGNPKLVSYTHDVIKHQIVKQYKHVFLTNGATGGVVITLRAYKQRGYNNCHTRNAPYYSRYPKMIEAADMLHIDETYHFFKSENVILLDMPSNPLGKITEINTAGIYVPTILDGVYLNRIYTSFDFSKEMLPKHDVYVGSYSKLLGMNGIRVGWIATNDDILALRIKQLVTSEYCGLSHADSSILIHILESLDWDEFEARANSRLNRNREQWSKLEKFFGNTPTLPNGMFYYAPVDKHCKKLLEKCGIVWTKGSDLGTDDSFGRFNVGQGCNLLEQAVSTILKRDRKTSKLR